LIALGWAFGLSPAIPQTSSLPSDPAALELRLKEALRLQPEQFDSHFALGGFYVQQGRLEDALPHLEKAHGIDPSHYACGYDLALLYLKTQRLAEARNHIQQMLARKEVAELHNLLGAVEEQSGNIETAAKELQRAAEMDPSEKHVFDYGNILLRYRAYEGALKILRYGSETYPHSAPLKVGLGIALYSRGQYDAAVEVLCQAVDLDPSDPRPLDFLGRMYDVSAAMAAEVTRRLEHFARLYPNNATANYFYALSLWKGDRQESAADLAQVETLLKKAIALQPRFHEAYFQLGALYERQERYREAIQQYRRTVELQPDFERAYYRLGQVYRRVGETDPAREALATYERLHRDSQEEVEEHPLELVVQ